MCRYSYSMEVKEEILDDILIKGDYNNICYFLTSFCNNSGFISIKKNKTFFLINVCSFSCSRKIIKILNKNFNFKDILITKKKNFKLNKTNIYQIQIGDNINKFLKDINYYLISTNYKEYLKILEENFLDFIKGYFLSNGSINNLYNSNYHFEFNVRNNTIANIIRENLKKIYNIDIKILERNNTDVLYLKDSILIGDFLSILGANTSRLKFEDVRIRRDMKNSVNRIINCELANEKKVLKSSQKQIENIKFLKKIKEIKYIKDRDKKILNIREQNPHLSLNELSIFLKKYDINITKSGLNHLFRKIDKKVNELVKNKKN